MNREIFKHGEVKRFTDEEALKELSDKAEIEFNESEHIIVPLPEDQKIQDEKDREELLKLKKLS
jgi:hypothetical protein